MRASAPARAPVTLAGPGGLLLPASLLLALVFLALVLLALVFLALCVRLQHILAAERRRGEAAIRELEEAQARQQALEAVLEAMPDGLLVLDPTLRVVLCNSRYATLTGLPLALCTRGPTLRSVLQAQAETGEFGLVDVEQEVAQQVARVHAGTAQPPVERRRPDGTIIELHHAHLPAGGFLVRCREVAPRLPVTAARDDAPSPLGRRIVLPPAPMAPPPAFAAITGLRPRRCLVLLVEDMPVNQMVTATQLRREGHRVDVASSGAEALRMVEAGIYDVVLMDLMMPGMSGYEAARRIRTLPPPAGQVVIHALTANAGEEERQRCLAAGMQGMLSKPVAPGIMARVLQQGAAAPTSIPQAASAPAALLDLARLVDLRRDLPPAALVSLCGQCLGDMDTRLAALRTALDEGAAEAVGQQAHALAGMAASYGLPLMAQAMQALMAATRAGDTRTARTIGQGLDHVFAESGTALRGWLRELGT